MSKKKIRLTIAALDRPRRAADRPRRRSGRDELRQPAQSRPDRHAPARHSGPARSSPSSTRANRTAIPTPAARPVDGVITKFRIRAYAQEDPGAGHLPGRRHQPAGPEQQRQRPGHRRGHRPDDHDRSPTKRRSETPITEVAGRLPVKKGQHLAIDTTKSIAAVYNSNGSKFSYVFAPPLVDGAGARGSNEAANELLVAATIEPDADGDGFGDETQDQCPTQATTQGACDVTPPGVSGFSVTNGDRSPTPSPRRRRSASQLEKKFAGRKVGKKCVKQTAKNKKKKKCSTFKPVGAAFTGTGAAGANTVTLPNGKKLKPGSYRLTMTARDVGRQRHGRRRRPSRSPRKRRRGKRRTGIEPASSAWKAEALPLSYRREAP